ncbi:cell wall-binding protein [Bacillus phage pW2]|uniref:Cell wall-binding protein n=1 Tax=Bacillus phage pW2 TaxID=2500559 RepID=A0A3T0II22_9CAUD|nr:cell wall-binding protein [Bacillus phage pW2]AZU99016.1 cell wall-binding protein [Bacillus phage pW2]
MKKFIIGGVMTVNLMLTIGVGAYSYNTIDRKNAEISDNKKVINKLNVDNADKNTRINDIESKMKDIEKKFIQSEETTKKQEQQITEQTQKIEEQNSQIQNYESKVAELEKELNFKKQKKGSDVKKKINIEQPKQMSNKAPEKNGRTITVEATAYTNHPSENGTYGGKVVTRTGLDISSSITYNGMGIIATDPSVIPLNSIVEIDGLGTYIALDTGGAIQGNRIDILMADSNQTYNWGRRNVNVTILN